MSMNPAFTGDDELIHIVIRYTMTKNRYGAKFFKVLTEEEAKKLQEDEGTAASVTTTNTWWKQDAWQHQQRLYDEAKTYNPTTGDPETNFTKLADRQMKCYLVKWDFKDEAGRDLPVTEELISNLHPALAHALLHQYRMATLIEGDIPN